MTATKPAKKPATKPATKPEKPARRPATGLLGITLPPPDNEPDGRRLDRKRGEGVQVYCSRTVKDALTRYAKKHSAYGKGIVDDAVITWLRAHGVEIELEDQD